MVTTSSATLHDRLARAPFLGLLVKLVSLIAVVIGLVVMSPTAQGFGESLGTPHVHAAHDLHASGTGHGVGDSEPVVAVEPAFVAAAEGSGDTSFAALSGALAAASGIALLVAALGMAIVRALRRTAHAGDALRGRFLPRVIPDESWLPSPPTPAALSVFRI